MALNFEFAFLGLKHSYVASVTPVTNSGYSTGPSDPACFRLPKSFTEGYEASSETRYIYDIRGHDFLCHTGRWATEDGRGISKKSENIVHEMGALRVLGQELEKGGYSKADFKLSLGPEPGSFFADVKKLERYRYETVPRDLNNAIQNELSEWGYGKISDVAMNATGGWVMYFREEAAIGRLWGARRRASHFCWGGEAALPPMLVTALRKGQDRGAKIRHISLNHQNPKEFVLLFSDGYAHVNLHDDFQKRIKELIDKWVTKTVKKRLNWNFTYSCQCHEPEQVEIDAAYYLRRGRFHILRSLSSPDSSCLNIDLALDYLGEAIAQDSRNSEIRHSQRLALVAARRFKKDPELEASIAEARLQGIQQTSLINARDSSAAGMFRNSYLQHIGSEEDCRKLESQLTKLNISAIEWSYSLASGSDRSSPIEFDFRRDDDQHRDSTVAVPKPTEMLGSIPSSYEQHAAAQMRTSVFSLDQDYTSQRRPSELSDDSSFTARRTPSGFSDERTATARWRASELSSDRVITSQRSPSGLGTEQNTAGQTGAQRRGSELSNAESFTIQRTISELAGDESAMVQNRSEPRDSQSFSIFRE